MENIRFDEDDIPVINQDEDDIPVINQDEDYDDYCTRPSRVYETLFTVPDASNTTSMLQL